MDNFLEVRLVLVFIRLKKQPCYRWAVMRGLLIKVPQSESYSYTFLFQERKKG